MDFSEFLTGYVYEESFLFDGFVLGFCLRGSLHSNLTMRNSRSLPKDFS